MEATNRKRGWKKPIIERARTLLNAALLRVAFEGDDDAFLRDLISLHAEAEQKIGVGIDHFEVRPNEWNGRTYWLVRIDGTETDFSFIKALTAPTPMQDFVKACRVAVVEQIIEFKRLAFASSAYLVCPITGEEVTWQTAHVDHAEPTFEKIAADFAATRADIYADVRPTADGEVATVFADQKTSKLFAEFHRERAVLRVVSRKANLSILKKSGK